MSAGEVDSYALAWQLQLAVGEGTTLVLACLVDGSYYKPNNNNVWKIVGDVNHDIDNDTGRANGNNALYDWQHGLHSKTPCFKDAEYLIIRLSGFSDYLDKTKRWAIKRITACEKRLFHIRFLFLSTYFIQCYAYSNRSSGPRQ